MCNALRDSDESQQRTNGPEPLAEGGEKHFHTTRLGVLDEHILHLVEIARNLNIFSRTGIK